MSDGKQCDHVTQMIEALRRSRGEKRLTLNSRFLDDEKLPEEERLSVLQEIFNRRVRERQISRVIRHLLPLLDGGHPETALIYGPTGAGKTVTLLHILNSLKVICSQDGIPFRHAHVDLASPKTHFAALNAVAIALDESTRQYRKGIPVDLMRERIIEAADRNEGFLCLLIDEIDNIQPNPDQFLTFLGKTLPRRTSARVLLILVTNRLDWERTLDPRILSFLKKTDIIFEPYDAEDLLEILRLRVDLALDKARIESGALEKIAAYASRETGDARKAVELLAKAVQVAEEATGVLPEKEVDEAERSLETDKTEEMIRALARQQRLALQACYLSLRGFKRTRSTGEAYRFYAEVTQSQATPTLSQRRFADMVSHLDLYGLVNARVVNKGRHGKTREISGSLPPDVVSRLLRYQFS